MSRHYILAECIGDALRAPGDAIVIPRDELEAWLAAAQALECEVLEHREREAQREVAVLLSQGGYNSVRNLRREERPSGLP